MQRNDVRAVSGVRLLPPSIPAVVFVVLALVIPTVLQKPLLNSDGDLARHLRHGQYMLEHGGLIRADPFSFTRPGAPFVGFEYGSQLLYAVAERIGGLPGVAIFAGLLIALTYALLARFLLRRGVDPLLAYLTVGLAAALGAGHWTARPHLFSFVAVVVLLAMLEGKGRKQILGCALLFVVWANLHGGFVYGWILIGLYAAGALAELWWSNDAFWKERARYYLTLLATAMAVTLLNPRGWTLHRHLFEFFGKPFLVDNTAEFISPDFHEPGGKVFLLILLACLGPLSLYPRRPTLPRLLVMCAGAAFALIAVRNIPLFGLTVLPLVALHVDGYWRRLPDPRGVRGRFEATALHTSTLPWALPVAVLLGALGVAGGRLGSLQIIAKQFDPTVFPVAAVAKARDEQLAGRLFSDFAWGGYVDYAWPEQSVFIDGGTDFFGEEIFREYVKIREMSPGWRDILARWNVSLALLERKATLAHELSRDPGWSLWYCDSLAVMLQRSPTLPSSVRPDQADSAEQQLNQCASRSSHPVGNRHQ